VPDITLEEVRQRLVLTVPETAKVMKSSTSWAYAACHRGQIPCKIMEGRIFVLAQPLLRQFGLLDDDKEGTAA
jgi:hypothetical protein